VTSILPGTLPQLGPDRHHGQVLFLQTFISVAGLKKVSSSRPGRVDFLTGQVTFHLHLPNGQAIRQVICQLIQKRAT